MAAESDKWWWVPAALLALAGCLFMFAAAESPRPIVWIVIGMVFIFAAGMTLRHRRG